ncbi:MAG: hypothetical protein KF893_02320 [Caldilineaceae bacterium]|nr:hypothetical protein [Caldilineaceae bacterium]
MKKKDKKKYVVPELTVYGSVETITKGNRDGAGVDAVFPIGIDKDQMTFS